MSNSLVSHLTGYVIAAFEDQRFTYTRASDWERDKTRLIHELANHGLSVLTISLPALSKHFDKCLDQSLYEPSELYLSRRVSKAVQVPAFLRNLYLQVFDTEGKLRVSPNPLAIAAIRQLYKGLTKVRLPCEQWRTFDEVKTFIDIEKELSPPTLDWDGDFLYGDFHGHDRVSPHSVSFTDRTKEDAEFSMQISLNFGESIHRISRATASTLQRVCDRVVSSLGDFHSEGDREFPKHGSGRVSNQRQEVSKYHFTDWPNKLDRTFPYDLYARTDFGMAGDRDRDRHAVLNREPSAKLIAVPKTMSGPRLIASEPNMHQWIQGLVANQLTQRFKGTVLRYCLDISDQSHNQAMALSSSQSGSHATVDLKSASDRLSCWTLERALRANKTLLERIHASRTRTLTNRVAPHLWDTISLKKAFTQGSAVTFPGQSLVYACFAIAAVIISRDWRVSDSSIRKAAQSVRIYGDDIIIPVDALVTLRDILVANQLKVNETKTFSKGMFRESCGFDAFDGVDVTPAYVKNVSLRPEHEEISSLVEASNNLHKRGLWNLAKWQLSRIGKHLKTLPVIDSRENAFGLSSFTGSCYDHLYSRWNEHLHRKEFLVMNLVSRPKTIRPYGSYSLYQFFIDKPAPTTKYEAVTIAKTSTVMRTGWSPVAY
jgi:hypothetical protein